MTTPARSDLDLRIRDLSEIMRTELNLLTAKMDRQNQTMTSAIQRIAAMEEDISTMKRDIAQIQTKIALPNTKGRFTVSKTEVSCESIVDELFKNKM